MLQQTRIIKRTLIAERTIALHLEKPEDFEFIPGQNIDLALQNHREIDSHDTGRTFSIASAPHEDEIMIGIRLRDNSYKKTLESLPLGSDVIIDGPYGLFKLHDDETVPAVFIAGGIGITPILSMLRHLKYTKRNYTIYLFYANRRPEDAAFLQELEDLELDLADYHFIPIMSRPELSSMAWHGMTGYVDIDLIKEHVPYVSKACLYVVGPSRMIWSTIQKLSGYINAARIKAEDFTGF